MKLKMGCFWLIVSLTALWAQHGFYLQVYNDAKAAMQLDDLEKANELFEIAAFGFLDYPDYLLSCRVRMALLSSHQGNAEELKSRLILVKSLRNSMGDSHQQIENAIWEEYLVLAGEKEPPSPPLPDSTEALNDLLELDVTHLSAWKRYVTLLKEEGRLDECRKLLKRARNMLPDNTFLLTVALEMDLDRRRTALDLAQSLLTIEPTHSLANEVLAHEAYRKKERLAARDHLQRVTEPLMPQTAQLRDDLDSWFLEQAKIATERIEPEQPENQDPNRQPPSKDVLRSDSENQANRVEEEPAETISEETSQEPEEEPAISDLSTRELERIVARDPSNTEARFELVTQYLQMRKFRKTQKHLLVLGRVDSQDPNYLDAFAHYHFLKGNYAQVIEGLEKQTNLNDKANYYLGKSFLAKNQQSEAYRSFARIKNLEPFPGLKAEVEDLRQSFGPDFQVTQQLLIDWDQGNLSIGKKRELMFSLLERLDRENAGTYLQRYLQEYPKDEMGRYFRARFALLNENFEQASEEFHRLVNTNFKGHEVYYWAGVAFFKANKPFVTKYMLDRALQTGSQHRQEIEEILTQIK